MPRIGSIAGANNTTSTNTIFDYIEKPFPGVNYNLKRVFSSNAGVTINLDKINKKLFLSVPQNFSDVDTVNVVFDGSRDVFLGSTYESDQSGNWGEIKGKVRDDCRILNWNGDTDGQHTMRIYYACFTDTNNPSAVTFQATGAEIYVNHQLVASTNSGMPLIVKKVGLLDQFVGGLDGLILVQGGLQLPYQLGQDLVRRQIGRASCRERV